MMRAGQNRICARRPAHGAKKRALSGLVAVTVLLTFARRCLVAHLRRIHLMLLLLLLFLLLRMLLPPLVQNRRLLHE